MFDSFPQLFIQYVHHPPNEKLPVPPFSITEPTLGKTDIDQHLDKPYFWFCCHFAKNPSSIHYFPFTFNQSRCHLEN